MKLRVVAEGPTSFKQKKFLYNLGFNEIHGYLVCQPLLSTESVDNHGDNPSGHAATPVIMRLRARAYESGTGVGAAASSLYGRFKCNKSKPGIKER